VYLTTGCCDWLTAAGALTAQCVGVSKTAGCKLIKRDDDTFTLNIRPQETGRHMLTIKFNNEHVPGHHHIILLTRLGPDFQNASKFILNCRNIS